MKKTEGELTRKLRKQGYKGKRLLEAVRDGVSAVNVGTNVDTAVIAVKVARKVKKTIKSKKVAKAKPKKKKKGY